MNNGERDWSFHGRHNHTVGGLVLLLVGLWLLVGNFIDVDLGALFQVGLGLVFLVWGIAARRTGLLIPGGILSGIGIGAWLIEGPFRGLEGEAEGGLFMVAFAFGWALITLTSAIFVGEVAWWPLIPGGIMAFIGSALLIGGPAMAMLKIIGQGWPIVLIAIGLYLMLWRKGLRE